MRRVILPAVLLFLAFSASARASGALPLRTVKLAGADGSTEPRLTVAPNDARYVITNGGGNAIVFKSTDQGKTWTRTANPVQHALPTIDTDAVAMPNGRVLVSELDGQGLNFPSSYTDDGGKTWTESQGSTELADQDRQWFAVGPDTDHDGNPNVYLLFHNLASGEASHNMWVSTSTDGGKTFGAPAPTTLPGSAAWADLQCADSGGPSSIAVNPKTGRIYVVFTTRAGNTALPGVDLGGCAAQPFEFNIVNATRVWVATSPDGSPGSWTQSLAVDQSQTGHIVSMQLAYGALDNQGGVYVAYPESPQPYPNLGGAAVKLVYQKPAADGTLADGRWSKPITLVPPSDPSKGGANLVHLAAGDPGRIAVAYYKGVTVAGADKPVWYTHLLHSDDVLAAKPSITDQQVSPVPAYKWTAGEMMGLCSDPADPAQGVENGLACDRSTDVWGITLDRSCRVSIAWPTASASSGGATTGIKDSSPGTYVTTQTGGPSLCTHGALPGAPSSGAFAGAPAVRRGA